MSPVRSAIVTGVRRGAIEFRNSLQTPGDVGYYIVGNLVFIVIVVLNRDARLEGTNLPTMLFILPGILAMQAVFSATYGLATLIATEREDGTLLRSKSLPNGMTGYVSGQVTRTTLEYFFSAIVLLVAATFLIEGVWNNGIGAFVALLGLIVLGLLSTIPLGIVFGSVFKNPRSVGGWGFLVLAGLIVISGLFFPVTGFPVWVQVIGQVFPLYWLGLGLRSVILPDAAVAVEIGESWRTLETIGVLGAWAVVGLLLAPVVLRRMARRESGSSVEERRQSALQRV